MPNRFTKEHRLAMDKVNRRNIAHSFLSKHEIQLNEDFGKTIGSGTVPYDKAIDAMIAYNEHMSDLFIKRNNELELLINNSIPIPCKENESIKEYVDRVISECHFDVPPSNHIDTPEEKAIKDDIINKLLDGINKDTMKKAFDFVMKDRTHNEDEFLVKLPLINKNNKFINTDFGTKMPPQED